MKKIDQSINAFAIFLTVFALGYMFVPAQTLGFMGFATDSNGLLFTRFIGSLGLGFVVLIWATKDAADAVRKPVVLALFTMMFSSFFVVLYQQLVLGFGKLGWFGVSMYAISAILLGYRYNGFSK